MAITLNVEPRRVMTWAEFRREKPPYSIALDGFVQDKTKRDEDGPYANFDHHHRSDRIATRSTAEQVHIETNLDLFDTFRHNGIPTVNIFVNDPDEDTSLAVWLLQNHERVISHAEPAINRLVYCEDRLDCTAGGYPLGDTEMRRRMAWIFEPYNLARFDGSLATMDAGGMAAVIESIGRRITEYSLGRGDERPLEGNYERIGGGDGWTMTRETGPASRLAMYNDGIKAYIALVAEKEDGSFVYTIGRKSSWVRSLRNDWLYRGLNRLEANIVTKENMWGGSDTIGGSPKKTGSKVPPERLIPAVIEIMGKKLVA
ncbi:hypothetical protein KY320_01900 [Candidatus Woesearchaeota archaeon]|nr:hypothetical protein [Candidatus Woesearchaeota archaeon]